MRVAGSAIAVGDLGLPSDTLEEATLIRPDGVVVRVTERSNPDLFWACRGGGGTVGVVTDMVLRTQLVPLMTSVTLTWAWERVREAFALYTECFRKAPDSLDLKPQDSHDRGGPLFRHGKFRSARR